MLINMSNDTIAEKKYSLAEGQITRALNILAKANGRDGLMVVIGESRLADVYLEQRRYTEAESLLKHAVSNRVVSSLEGHRVAAYCLYLLGELAKDRHEYAEAGRNYQEAISIYEKTAPRSSDLAIVPQHYSGLLRIKRNDESKTLARRAKELQGTLKSSKQ